MTLNGESQAGSKRAAAVVDSGQPHRPGKKGPYPKSVLFIVSNEFCERFSYYGMRTVLVLYLSSILLYSDADTKLIYHAFTMVCYFTPLLGAILADSWLGKFKTIFYISIIYAIGNGTLSLGAFNLGMRAQTWLSLAGLALIGLGTGGIKPCVAAFGGDQFVRGQELYLEQFFSIFYMCINAGSVLSTAITPVLRGYACDGRPTCFPLAFGVPAVLMVVSLVLFLMGRPFYRINPPGENVIVKLVGCISRAIVNKFSPTSLASSRSHWLDYADDKYDKKFIEDVKAVCRVLVIYVPVPIFWALFDQQGSTWTLQATRMRWRVFGVELLPDQVQLLNPLFILVLAPLFSYAIYPLCKKCGLLTKPLQKMLVGGLLAAASFIVCMFLQIAVESQDSNAMTLVNASPCVLNVSYAASGQRELGGGSFEVATGRSSPKIRQPLPAELRIEPLCADFRPLTYRPSSSHKAPREKLVVAGGANEAAGNTGGVTGPQRTLQVVDVPELGKGNVADVKVLVKKDLVPALTITGSHNGVHNFSKSDTLEVAAFSMMRAEVEVTEGQSYSLKSVDGSLLCEDLKLLAGEGYVIMVFDNGTCSASTTLAAPSLSLLWQAPQYILITAGEVMFSVTGLEFSYSQAPVTMKSVLQAAWLMTVAIGNFLVVIVAKIGLEKQSTEFLVFGLAMFADMVVFASLAYYYTPVSAAGSSDIVEDSEERYRKDKCNGSDRAAPTLETRT